MREEVTPSLKSRDFYARLRGLAAHLGVLGRTWMGAGDTHISTSQGSSELGAVRSLRGRPSLTIACQLEVKCVGWFVTITHTVLRIFFLVENQEKVYHAPTEPSY